MNWNQPVCDPCWEEVNPGREPVRFLAAPQEQCCRCGEPTTSGIYVRAHPGEVSFPKYEDT